MLIEGDFFGQCDENKKCVEHNSLLSCKFSGRSEHAPGPKTRVAARFSAKVFLKSRSILRIERLQVATVKPQSNRCKVQ
jgi:hypothetical protein